MLLVSLNSFLSVWPPPAVITAGFAPAASEIASIGSAASEARHQVQSLLSSAAHCPNTSASSQGLREGNSVTPANWRFLSPPLQNDAGVGIRCSFLAGGTSLHPPGKFCGAYGGVQYQICRR